ncbi:MAG: hypothetical protein U0271_22100 [Polyangiaceae bacterium]
MNGTDMCEASDANACVPSPAPAQPRPVPAQSTVAMSRMPWEEFMNRPARALSRLEATAILNDLARRGWLHLEYGNVNNFPATDWGVRVHSFTVGGRPFHVTGTNNFWDLRVGVLLYRLAHALSREVGAIGLRVEGFRPPARIAYGVHDQGRALDIFGAAFAPNTIPRDPSERLSHGASETHDVAARVATPGEWLEVKPTWSCLALRPEREGTRNMQAPVLGYRAIEAHITAHASEYGSAHHQPRLARIGYPATTTIDDLDYQSIVGRAYDASQAALRGFVRGRIELASRMLNTILRVVYENASLNTHSRGHQRGATVGSGLTEEPNADAADLLTWDEVVHPDYRGAGRVQHYDHIHAPIGPGAWIRDYDDGWTSGQAARRGTVDPRDRAAMAQRLRTILLTTCQHRYPQFGSSAAYDPVRRIIEDEVAAETADTTVPTASQMPLHLRVLRTWVPPNRALPPRRDVTSEADMITLAGEIRASLETYRQQVIATHRQP